MGIRNLKFEKSEIIGMFEKEFASVKDLFKIIELRLDSAESDTNEAAAKPGVYVYRSLSRKMSHLVKQLFSSPGPSGHGVIL